MGRRRVAWGCGTIMLLMVGVMAALALQRWPTDSSDVAAGPPYGEASVVCEVDDPRIAESSGLVVVGDRGFTVNDSGPRLEIFVLDLQCAVLEVLSYPEIDPVDVEDLAVTADGELWVADTGDNNARRSEVALYRIPRLGAGTPSTLALRYDDGPHDVETMLLSPEGVPYLLTKTPTGRSGVYAPTAELASGSVTTLTRVADVQFRATGTAGGPVGFLGQLLATGGSVATDGGRFVVRTYTDAYVWDLGEVDVLTALREAEPRLVALPPTRQGEAVALTADAGEMYSTTEGSPFPLHVQPRAG